MTSRGFGFVAGLVCFLTLVLTPACRGQGLPAIPAQVPTIPVITNAVLYVQGFHPPPQYAKWYRDVERCTGLKGNFAKVRWFVTPLPWTDGSHNARLTYGAWRKPHKIIINAPEVLDSALISHEILHDILARNGLQSDATPHPAPWFGTGPDSCSEEYHA